MKDMKVMTIHVPADLHKKFKLRCMTHGHTMRKVVSLLMEVYCSDLGEVILRDSDGKIIYEGHEQ